jgi:polysaccharide deacetylase 2 family uncharacterized protein YibQ
VPAGVQTGRLESIARARGHAIGIGHVRPATVAAVRAAVEEWRSSGIRLVRVSEAMRRDRADAEPLLARR